jgi:hypothetical protein
MFARQEKAQRKLGAYLCLLATMLLYAPLTALAWSASAMSCCDGDHCPLHQHDHQNTQKHAMDCGHESDEMTACSMDCCHTSEKATLTALTFVLPRPGIAADAVIITRASEVMQSSEIRSFPEPLSPPPRLAAAVL